MMPINADVNILLEEALTFIAYKFVILIDSEFGPTCPSN